MQIPGCSLSAESLGYCPQRSRELAGTLLDFAPVFEAFTSNACLNTNQSTSYSSHGAPRFQARSPCPSGRRGHLACQSREGGGSAAETLRCVVLWSRPRSAGGPPAPGRAQRPGESEHQGGDGEKPAAQPSRPVARCPVFSWSVIWKAVRCRAAPIGI